MSSIPRLSGSADATTRTALGSPGVLQASDISRRFGDRVVLDGIELVATPGRLLEQVEDVVIEVIGGFVHQPAVGPGGDEGRQRQPGALAAGRLGDRSVPVRANDGSCGR